MTTLCQCGANQCNAKFIINECKLLKHPNHMAGPEAEERDVSTDLIHEQHQKEEFSGSVNETLDL